MEFTGLEDLMKFLEANGGGLALWSPEEGEDQIARLLGRTGDVARVPVEPFEVGGAGHLITPAGDLRTLPSHNLDGFFAARLRRR